MTSLTMPMARYGMAIDLDRCNGCGACATVCAVENNVPPGHPEADDRKGLTWLRVHEVSNGQEFPSTDSFFVPLFCQQCDAAPCASVCPQNAVDVNPQTGVVSQIPARCLGCRYCMAACPYHARVFNWWDPKWPAGMEKALSPDVSVRMRGTVEKCNFCHARWQSAKEKAAAEGRRDIDPADYVPACVEACPTKAIVFGNLDDPESEVAKAARSTEAFQLLAPLGTGPKVFFRSARAWVRASGNPGAVIEEEARRG